MYDWNLYPAAATPAEMEGEKERQREQREEKESNEAEDNARSDDDTDHEEEEDEGSESAALVWQERYGEDNLGLPIMHWEALSLRIAELEKQEEEKKEKKAKVSSKSEKGEYYVKSWAGNTQFLLWGLYNRGSVLLHLIFVAVLGDIVSFER